jgi:hypothetical protein
MRTCSWGLWGLLCLTGGPHRKGAERPLRRARGHAVARKRKGKQAGVIAHRGVQNLKQQRERKEKRRSGPASTVTSAAPRRKVKELREASWK